MGDTAQRCRHVLDASITAFQPHAHTLRLCWKYLPQFPVTHPDDARHCEILMMSKAPLLLGFESGPTLVAFLLLKPERDKKALFIIGLKSLSKTMQRNMASGVLFSQFRE